MGQTQKEQKYWKNIPEVSISPNDDNTMEIDVNQKTDTPATVESSTTATDVSLPKLGIASLYHGIRTISTISITRSRHESSKSLQERPRSVISEVELSIDDEKPNRSVNIYFNYLLDFTFFCGKINNLLTEKIKWR